MDILGFLKDNWQVILVVAALGWLGLLGPIGGAIRGLLGRVTGAPAAAAPAAGVVVTQGFGAALAGALGRAFVALLIAIVVVAIWQYDAFQDIRDFIADVTGTTTAQFVRAVINLPGVDMTTDANPVIASKAKAEQAKAERETAAAAAGQAVDAAAAEADVAEQQARKACAQSGKPEDCARALPPVIQVVPAAVEGLRAMAQPSPTPPTVGARTVVTDTVTTTEVVNGKTTSKKVVTTVEREGPPGALEQMAPWLAIAVVLVIAGSVLRK